MRSLLAASRWVSANTWRYRHDNPSLWQYEHHNRRVGYPGRNIRCRLPRVVHEITPWRYSRRVSLHDKREAAVNPCTWSVKSRRPAQPFPSSARCLLSDSISLKTDTMRFSTQWHDRSSSWWLLTIDQWITWCQNTDSTSDYAFLFKSKRDSPCLNIRVQHHYATSTREYAVFR